MKTLNSYHFTSSEELLPMYGLEHRSKRLGNDALLKIKLQLRGYIARVLFYHLKS